MERGKKTICKLNKVVLIALVTFCLCLLAFPAQELKASSAKELSPPLDTVITNVGNYIYSVDTDPDYNSIWNMLGMIRSGRQLPQDYIENYYNNTLNYLEENNWQITRAKYSDYSKLILGMTVIGKDAKDIGGHDLFEYLADFNKVKLQGVNGPIWALIALKSHPSYQIPIVTGVREQTTEEGLVTYILSKQILVGKGETGGWALSGSVPDTDITGMTIQALAPYYGKRDDVTAAVDKALLWLSNEQNSYGGYSTLNGSGTVETSESDDQVIVALSALGIDCGTDERFIKKNGNWILSRLFEYYSPVDKTKGGFMHVFAGSDNNGGGAAGSIDGMATEQGLYAAVSYQRMLEGKTALYDMSDITLSSGEKPEPPSTKSTEKETEPAVPKTKKIKVTKLVLNYRQITLKKGKTRTLKLKIYPAGATNKKVKWTSSDKKVATVTQKGKVRAVKAGKAIITVTARDGSKKKTTCKVIVKKPASEKKKTASKIKVTGVNINYSQISVAAGESRDLNAVVTPSDASDKRLSWWSSNTGIARVNQSGEVRGVSSGTTTINAKTKDGSGKSASCTVIVYNSGRQNSSGSNQNATTQAGANTGTQSTSATEKEPSEAATRADAWSFDGDTYIPETDGDETEEEEADLTEDGEDEEKEGSEDFAGQSRMQLSPWLAILLGLVIPGMLLGSFRVPWSGLRKFLLLPVAKRRKKK